MIKQKLNDSDLKRLRIFITIVECGGFSPAEPKLGLSAASISIHMSELELKLGVTLCKRGRAGFSLTPEGERIYEACQSLMLAHNNFELAVGKAKGQLSGELRLGVIDNAVFDPNLKIPKLISDFRKIAPLVEISLHTLSPSELERGILDQRLHLAIGVFYERRAGLDYHPVCNERLTLYCGSAHKLFDQKPISLAEIKSSSFVERTYGASVSRLNMDIELKKNAYTSSLEATLLLILSGEYIGFLPEYYAQNWQSQNQVKSIWVNKLFIESEVSILVHKHPANMTMTNIVRQLLSAGG